MDDVLLIYFTCKIMCLFWLSMYSFICCSKHCETRVKDKRSWILRVLNNLINVFLLLHPRNYINSSMAKKIIRFVFRIVLFYTHFSHLDFRILCSFFKYSYICLTPNVQKQKTQKLTIFNNCTFSQNRVISLIIHSFFKYSYICLTPSVQKQKTKNSLYSIIVSFRRIVWLPYYKIIIFIYIKIIWYFHFSFHLI